MFDEDTVRVMVVDDSAVIRGLTTRILESDEKIKVVASVGNGQMAVNNLPRHDIDVVVLDIEMPVMDGLTALPKLLELDSSVRVLMSSTLTSRNAEISMRALEAGASDYIPKPTSTSDISTGGDFRRELLDKVKNLGLARRRTKPAESKPVAKAPETTERQPVKVDLKPRTAPTKSAMYHQVDLKFRKPSTQVPKILAIGSSTGGPQALFEFLKHLSPNINVPVVLTQHMPATFTSILAEHISRQTPWTCTEGKDGEALQAGNIYLAPGDYHMLIVDNGGRAVIKLDQGPQENFCRPAVDPMLRSLVKIYGARILTVILTGMGADGLKGSELVVQSGGTIVAQDEDSSVVWGMPGAVATAGLCSAVLPLKELAQNVMKFYNRGVA